jgi:hypothetical protein
MLYTFHAALSQRDNLISSERSWKTRITGKPYACCCQYHCGSCGAKPGTSLCCLLHRPMYLRVNCNSGAEAWDAFFTVLRGLHEIGNNAMQATRLPDESHVGIAHLPVHVGWSKTAWYRECLKYYQREVEKVMLMQEEKALAERRNVYVEDAGRGDRTKQTAHASDNATVAQGNAENAQKLEGPAISAVTAADEDMASGGSKQPSKFLIALDYANRRRTNSESPIQEAKATQPGSGSKHQHPPRNGPKSDKSKNNAAKSAPAVAASAVAGATEPTKAPQTPKTRAQRRKEKAQTKTDAKPPNSKVLADVINLLDSQSAAARSQPEQTQPASKVIVTNVATATRNVKLAISAASQAKPVKHRGKASKPESGVSRATPAVVSPQSGVPVSGKLAAQSKRTRRRKSAAAGTNVPVGIATAAARAVKGSPTANDSKHSAATAAASRGTQTIAGELRSLEAAAAAGGMSSVPGKGATRKQKRAEARAQRSHEPVSAAQGTEVGMRY